MTMPEQKKAVTPRLRFPEFRNAGPWEVKQLGELIETVTPSKKLQTADYLSEGRYPIIDQSLAPIAGWTDDESAVIREHLPLILFGDHTCVIKIVSVPFCQGADGIKILATKREVDPYFLYEFLLAFPIQQKEYRRHFSILKQKAVRFPKIQTGEQQKIADCLSSLDELIELQAKQLEALQAHKKGLMQQLFPHEGETTPRLRFPEFRDAGPWENIQVSDFGTIVTGKTPSTSNPKYWNGRFAWVTPTDIPDTKYIYTTDRLLTSEGVQLIGVLPENTVLITCIASIGKNAILKVPGSCNQQINAIIPNSNFNSDFIYYLFCKNQTILQNQAGTSATAIIPKSAFEKFYFHVPKLPEQQKIADCLSSLDELIELQAKQLEALQAHKKGLMQQLFPQEIDL